MDQWLTDQEYWLFPKNKRLKELKSQYPKLPMAVIIQNDVMSSGVKPTPFVWEIAAKYGGTPGVAFQNRDHHQFFMTKEHQVKPRSFQLPDDTYCLFVFGPDAPYEVKPGTTADDDKVWLYRDDEPVVQISFAESTKGHLCGIEGGYSLRHCSLFNTGEQCHFCSITPEQKHRQAIGYEKAQSPYTPVAEMQASMIEAAKEGRANWGPYLDANVPCGQDNCSCFRVNMTIGALGSYEKELEYHHERVRAVKEVIPGLPIHLTAGALKEADAKDLAGMGVHVLCENLEVWDEKLFDWICPGKQKHVGRDVWLERLVSAVKHYPRGHVMSNFVAGVEMAQPHGFKTVDEALKSTLGGWEWLMQQGVAPYYQVWATAPGSTFEDQKTAPIEYYLSLAQEWYRLALQYDIIRATTYMCKRCGNNAQGPFNRMRWHPGGFPPDGTLRPEMTLEEHLKQREERARERKLARTTA